MFAVGVNKLYKYYKLYKSPFDRLKEAIFRKPYHQLIESLKDISFSLSFRDSLGIIGENGAGKSTLLKILSGTLTPSSGSVSINGRVSALLELGAGFHSEFTGRQNIYLNASLLGLSHSEIKNKEEEIIDFAEIGEFIDRPIKTYSSGMVIRLAFAIASSVDPDILIIDEALSVGDQYFQKKCIERMNRFRELGKTMIFCSHSMYHVKELCNHVIWLDHGTIRLMGGCHDVISQYEDYSNSKKVKENTHTINETKPESIQKDCIIRNLCFETPDGKPVNDLLPFEDIVMKMEVDILKDGICPQFGFAFIMPDETVLAANITHHDGLVCGPYNKGETIVVKNYVRNLPVREGAYRLLGGVSDNGGLLWYEFKYSDPISVSDNRGFGRIAFRHEWDINREPLHERNE